MRFLFFALSLAFAASTFSQKSVGTNKTNVVCSLSVSLSGTPPLCYKGMDGIINATVSNSTGTVVYNWPGFPGVTGPTLNSAMPYPTTCIVSDTSGCSDTATITLGQPTMVTIPPATITLTTCPLDNGTATVSPAGGTPGYTYFWSNGDTSATADSLKGGVHFVQAWDSHGCYATATIIVNSTNGPAVTIDSTHNISCHGANDGEIFISVSGGASPYSYYWSNGEHSQDISNLNGVPYDIVVKDATGCEGGNIVVMNEPPDLSVSFTTMVAPACADSNGQVFLLPGGGTIPFSYQWDANAGGGTTPFAMGLKAGTYKAWIYDANGCTDSTIVLVNNITGPVITIDSLVSAGCASVISTGAVYTSISSSNGPISLLWSNGANTDDIISVPEGEYFLTATDASNCKSFATASVYGINPGTVQLCMTTVDSSTHMNQITWEKNVPGIAQYKIYRESCLQDIYTLIATIPADSMSQFTDTVADPDSKPYRYQIEALDSCGKTSTYSLSHKTIHLAVAPNQNNIFNNLSWDNYQGLNYTGFNILRYHYTTGWLVIGTVSAGTNFFTDTAPLAPSDSNYYFVEINNNGSCSPTYKIAPGVSPQATIKKSRSNVNNNRVNGMTTSIKENGKFSFSVYPNPAAEEITLQLSALSVKSTVIITDISGRAVLSQNITGLVQTINVSILSRGVYFVSLMSDGKQTVKKLIIE